MQLQAELLLAADHNRFRNLQMELWNVHERIVGKELPDVGSVTFPKHGLVTQTFCVWWRS